MPGSIGLIPQLRPLKPKQLNLASGYSWWFQQCCFPSNKWGLCSSKTWQPPSSCGKRHQARTSASAFYPFPVCTMSRIFSATHGSNNLKPGCYPEDWLCHGWHPSFPIQPLLLQQQQSHSFFLFSSESVTILLDILTQRMSPPPKVQSFLRLKSDRHPHLQLPLCGTPSFWHIPRGTRTLSSMQDSPTHCEWASAFLEDYAVTIYFTSDSNSPHLISTFLKTYFYFFWDILNSFLFNTVTQPFSLVHYKSGQHFIFIFEEVETWTQTRKAEA